MALPFSAFSDTYTAVVSGKWSSTLTWGGNIPPDTISGDDMIVIGANVVVDMDVDVMLDNELATITLLGDLEGESQLSIETGSVIGTGTLAVEKLIVGSQGRVLTTGSIVCDTLESLSTALTLAANTKVDAKLLLAAGILEIESAGELTLGTDAIIEIAGGSISGEGKIQSEGTINLIYTDSCRSTGREIDAGVIGNLTVDLQNGYDSLTVNGDITVNDTLNFKSGIMTLNGFNLTLNGKAEVTGFSSLFGDVNSGLFINGSDSIGVIVFSDGGGVLDSLLIDIGSMGEVELHSNLEITNALLIGSGQLKLQQEDLLIHGSAMIAGGVEGYVNISGEGQLAIELFAGDSSTLFPVGSDLGYFPCEILQNTGAEDTVIIEVGVMQGVFSEGTAGIDLSATMSVVNNTWLIDSRDTTAELDLDFEFFWDLEAEVNGFNNGLCYISHFVDNAWDASVSVSAETQANGQVSVSRTGITSLSPFSVMDRTTTNYHNLGERRVKIFPNPVSEQLWIDVTEEDKALQLRIFDARGNLIYDFPPKGGGRLLDVSDLPSGQYILILGNDHTERFIKQ